MQGEKIDNMGLPQEEGQMKRGFTTGTCSAAAAKAAAYKALGKTVETVEIQVPKGYDLKLAPEQDISYESSGIVPLSEEEGFCAIRKYSGDDPDVTNGVLVYAQVVLEPRCASVEIDGGVGVGRVTMPGLPCQIGQAAINPVPRRMIGEAVRQAFDDMDYEGGCRVVISIPEGVELAKRTYNPQLGVTGGISILGTSGIVEPMSEKALVDTIKVEMDVRKALGAEYLVITPGNYGQTFIRENFTDRDIYFVKCSNFIGETLDYAERLGFKGILYVAHMGKMVKVAGGIMNTHSKYADGRMEIMAAHTGRIAGKPELLQRIMSCITTDSAYEAVLEESRELASQVVDSMLERVNHHLKLRTHETMEVGAIMFSNKHGLLGQTDNAESLLAKILK